MTETAYKRAEAIKERVQYLSAQKQIIQLGQCWRAPDTNAGFGGGLAGDFRQIAREAIERQIDLEAVALEKEFKEL